MSCQGNFPPGFFISFFTAVLKVPKRPLRWWPLACGLSPCHPLYQMLILPTTWAFCIKRNGCSHEVLFDGFGEKITYWVLFWKHKPKSTILENPDCKKNALKVERASIITETFKLVEPLKEAKVSKTEVFPKVANPCALAKITDGAKVELGHRGRSLLQLPRTAVKSVSTLMVSALQSGWQMCSWKSSVSSTSVPSQMRAGSPLQSPEAEMLREVYLVLWAIRKQLRQLARRAREAQTAPHPDPHLPSA